MNRRGSLFLIELVADLVLFVLSAAVCVGLLVHARAMSQESTQLTQAVYLAQSAAEEWKQTGRPPVWDAPDAQGFLCVFDRRDADQLDISIYHEDRLVYVLEGVTRIE